MINKGFNSTYQVLTIICAGLIFGCSPSEDLNWHEEEEYIWADLSPGFWGDAGFSKLKSSSTNIQFHNYTSDTSIADNRNFLNGSGVTTADVDGDGKVDVYFAQLEGPNKLYRNKGNFVFEDITEEAGLAHDGYNSTGVVFVDVDGDNDSDLIIASLFKGIELYINDGDGHFTHKKNSGLGEAKGSNTMALADIDGDGDLDLYVSNFKTKSARDIFSADELATENTVRKQGDSLVIIPPYDQYYGIIKTDGRSYRNEYGAKDDLYINNGDGQFTKAEDEKHFYDVNGKSKGLSRDWGLAAKFQDINNDRLPDLYIANDFWTPDRIWINQGKGEFKSISKYAIRNMSLSAMGVDFSDVNRDGHVDFFVTEMLSQDHQRHKRQLTDYLDPIDGRPQYNRNSFYLNRGDHTFAEISSYGNVEASEWSWAAEFLDIDLDGYEDLLITTGNQYDYLDMDTQMNMNHQSMNNEGHMGNILEYPSLKVSNKIFRNNKKLTFSDKSSSWGFLDEDISMGLAVADLDNDGDGDLVINRLNDEAAVYENTSNDPRIAIELQGITPNTQGIGAKVELTGGPVTQTKEITSGGTYVSGSEPAVFFAADDSHDHHTIQVTWRDGTISRVDSVRANRKYVIKQLKAENPKKISEDESNDSLLFQDVSGQLTHTHTEESYNDFKVQPLLPHNLSQLGPGISWFDYDQDGKDDLFVAAGRGDSLAVFKNVGAQNFESIILDELNEQAIGDQTTLLGWQENGESKIIVGSANFEQGNPDAPSAYLYSINNSGEVTKNILPGQLSTTGPLALGDYDNDGYLDLFMGGRFIPGGYPKDATSRLFSNTGDGFSLNESQVGVFNDLGMVTGAVFSDYDQDGDLDLIMSRAWDSIVILNNEEGNFREVTKEVGLDHYEGWWNGVATGDFNNDGRPDIITTNIGNNSIYQTTGEQPLKLYYGDFDMNGTLDIIDSYFDTDVQGFVPRKKLYEFDSMPSVLGSVGTHNEFSRSTVSQIFKQNFDSVPSKQINTTEHMLFLNKEDGFEAYALPVYSQISSAFGPVVADFNNDGNEDLFISQNTFDFPPNIPRQDAGRGLLMLGDGKGNLEVLKGHNSGIKVYGEQRGAAASDFNQDGKVDLAITQNQDQTKLFLNQVQQPGIRVTLVGPESNTKAIGSSVRIIYSNGRRGPIRETQAGSGYWSQQSATQVFGKPDKAEAIEVNWFDGKTEVFPINGQMDMALTY